MWDRSRTPRRTRPITASFCPTIDPAAITTRAALAQLPVTRKSDLKDIQAQHPPFGGLNGWGIDRLAHIYQSPGPIYEPDGDVPDHWRFARSLWAAGVRPGMIVHNSFSYHLTPAGMIIESGARAIGCPVIPAGVGNTELQVQAIADLRPAAYCGTPSFLKILLEKARESRRRHVFAEDWRSSALKHCRRRCGRRSTTCGVFALQNYGTADLGLVAYESRAMEGMIVDEGVALEIVRPGTGEPVTDGEVGEVVVTTFNPVYPLIRFATGDLSAVLAGPSPCGRTNMRIKGWMGRADQTTKVKGMFVHPQQVAQVAARHPGDPEGSPRSGKSRQCRRDDASLRGQWMAMRRLPPKSPRRCSRSARSAVASRLSDPGELPNDGKVIADLRSYR